MTMRVEGCGGGHIELRHRSAHRSGSGVNVGHSGLHAATETRHRDAMMAHAQIGDGIVVGHLVVDHSKSGRDSG